MFKKLILILFFLIVPVICFGADGDPLIKGAADSITDVELDFGAGANQIDADDIPESATRFYDADGVDSDTEYTGTANEIGLTGTVFGLVDNPTIPGTGAMIISGGSTGTRPGGTYGQFRFNSTLDRMEWYTTGWHSLLDDQTSLFDGAYGSLTGSPTIPDELSDLSDDATHRTVTDTEKSTYNGKQDALTAGTDYLAPDGDASGLQNLPASYSFATANTSKTFSAAEITGKITLRNTASVNHVFPDAETLYDLQQKPAIFVFETDSPAYFDLGDTDFFIIDQGTKTVYADGYKFYAGDPRVSDRFTVEAIHDVDTSVYSLLVTPISVIIENAGP